MAQYIIAALLHAAQHFELIEPFRERRDWGMRMQFRADLLLGRTLGLLGYGGVGRDVSGMAVALGMRVIAMRRSLDTRTDQRFEVSEYAASRYPGADITVQDESSLEQVLRASDILACTLPLTTATAGLIGRRELALLKPGCIVINVSRGAVIDEAALIEALERGSVARAYIDVFADEPLRPDDPLWSAPNTVLTPHASGIHDRASELGSRLFIENLRRFVSGERLLNLVDRTAGY
jgi:phosphoglycerate dehydrogenase-like enzyme